MSRSQADVTATGVALADALAAANLAFAYIFWRAARHKDGERTAVYAALLLFGLRAVGGTYQVLYQLEGRAAVASLLDMVTSLALFVGMLNTLPGYLRRPAAPAAGRESPES
jgi:heme A synthase